MSKSTASKVKKTTKPATSTKTEKGSKSKDPTTTKNVAARSKTLFLRVSPKAIALNGIDLSFVVKTKKKNYMPALKSIVVWLTEGVHADGVYTTDEFTTAVVAAPISKKDREETVDLDSLEVDEDYVGYDEVNSLSSIAGKYEEVLGYVMWQNGNDALGSPRKEYILSENCVIIGEALTKKETATFFQKLFPERKYQKRSLWVDTIGIELSFNSAKFLIENGLVNECGDEDGHDLHLVEEAVIEKVINKDYGTFVLAIAGRL